MRKVLFEKSALIDFKEWKGKDNKIHSKIIMLISEIVNDPFKGIGKPEPLRAQLRGYWSRRINNVHRLVY